MAQRLKNHPRLDVTTLNIILTFDQILNVQVPFYFKNIVDSMNVDFVALGGTAWTVGGAMIVACMDALDRLSPIANDDLKMVRQE